MPSDYKSKRDQLIANASDIEVLILGDSHTANGVTPFKFSLYAHNLAFGSQTIYFDRRLLEKYLPILPKLKYVILSYDYNILHKEDAYERDFFYKYYYDINFKNKKYYKEQVLQSIFVYSLDKTLSLISDDLKKRNVHEILQGCWVGEGTFSDYRFITSPEKVKMRLDFLNGDIFNSKNKDSILADLEFTLDTLRSLNIKTILLDTPVYPTLSKQFNKDVLKKNRQTGEYLAQKYGAIYLDYMDDADFVISDFYDSDHLNGPGGVKLTSKLDSIIMEMENNKNR
jgi:hypothetical protein